MAVFRLTPRTLRVLALMGVALLLYVAAELTWPAAFLKPGLTDFDVFHLVGRMVWEDDLGTAYDPVLFQVAQAELPAHGGRQRFDMYWSYPPPFDLAVAPLGLLPIWLAYLLFLGGTGALYVWVLRRLAGDRFHLVLLLVLPAMALIARCGQNGLLTGSLAGLTCLLLLEGRRSGGVALGLMVIKPHLALGLGLTLLLRRRWWAAAALAVVTATIACLVATLLLGPDVWAMFEGAARATGGLLTDRKFPLFRMSSAFATALAIGATPEAALAFHVAVAAAALSGLVALRLQGREPRVVLGWGLVASLLVSPYNYDYDLAMLGVAAALLADTVARHVRGWEAALIGAGFVVAGGSGLLTGFVVGFLPSALPTVQGEPVPVVGPAVLALAITTFAVLSRAGARAQTGNAAPALA